MVRSYLKKRIKCPHAPSISATEDSGRFDFHPPALASRTKGTSCRVFLVEDHKCPCSSSSFRIWSAEQRASTCSSWGTSACIPRKRANLASSCVGFAIRSSYRSNRKRALPCRVASQPDTFSPQDAYGLVLPATKRVINCSIGVPSSTSLRLRWKWYCESATSRGSRTTYTIF